MCDALQRRWLFYHVALVLISKSWYVTYSCVLTVFCEWKTSSIGKIICQFSQVNFHQINLEHFINTESLCVYFFFFLEVYVDILSRRKSLVAAHTWIVIYALLGYHIVFCIEHVLKFVNITGVHAVVMNHISFLLSYVAVKYIYAA